MVLFGDKISKYPPIRNGIKSECEPIPGENKTFPFKCFFYGEKFQNISFFAILGVKNCMAFAFKSLYCSFCTFKWHSNGFRVQKLFNQPHFIAQTTDNRTTDMYIISLGKSTYERMISTVLRDILTMTMVKPFGQCPTDNFLQQGIFEVSFC